MILAEMSHTALYLMTEAAFNSGLNPHVYVTYRHMASEHLLFGVLNASVGLISLAGVEASFAGVDCTPSIFMIETSLFSTLSLSLQLKAGNLVAKELENHNLPRVCHC